MPRSNVLFYEALPCCAICVYSEEIPGVDDLLCSKKGVVAGDFKCKKFEVNSLLINTKRKRAIRQYGSAEDYKIN